MHEGDIINIGESVMIYVQKCDHEEKKVETEGENEVDLNPSFTKTSIKETAALIMLAFKYKNNYYQQIGSY